jgi:hypothetical protein
VFSAFHAACTWQLLRARQIGTCDDATSDLLVDFRRLRADMQAAGLFESNKLYYVFKVRGRLLARGCALRCTSAHARHDAEQCSSNLAICALSLLVLRASAGYAALLTSAFIMVCALLLRTRSDAVLMRLLRGHRRSSGSSAAGWRTTSCTTRCSPTARSTTRWACSSETSARRVNRAFAAALAPL